MTGSVFLTLLVKLIPLYINIVVGFVAGKVLRVQRESIANLIFYVIVPLVVFSGVSRMPFSMSLLSLPFLVLFIASGISLATYFLARRWWSDNSANILAFAAGTGNTGYFGLPVAMLVFPESTVGVYMMSFMGVIFYECTLGYFITARGTSTLRESAIKVAKLPTLYAFLGGLFLSIMQWPLPVQMNEYIDSLRATYSFLGMMVIGLGLAGLSSVKLDGRFIFVSIAARYGAWPGVIALVLWLDTVWLHLYEPAIHQALILLAVVPMAANTVVVATVLGAQPEKAACAVIIQSLLALLIVPWVAATWLVQ